MNEVLRILAVDDDVTVADSIKRNLETTDWTSLGLDVQEVSVLVENNFARALETLDERKFDIAILDILQENAEGTKEPLDRFEAGMNLFDAIRRRQFVPLIFYAGDPRPAEEFANPPFVQAVSKIDGAQALTQAIASIVECGLPEVLRLVERNVDSVVRDFFADFLEGNWPQLSNSKPDTAFLLARTLGHEFVAKADLIAQSLDESAQSPEDGSIHPHRYYAVPPRTYHSAGDIYCQGESEHCSRLSDDCDYWVLLTPTCDMVGLGLNGHPRVPKAERVLLAECRPIEEFPLHQKWSARMDAGCDVEQADKALAPLLGSRPRGQEDRFLFLPAAWDMPDLMVDLQRVTSIEASELLAMKKVASLDSPFTETLTQRYARLMGRVGTPDLDVAEAIERMRSRR